MAQFNQQRNSNRLSREKSSYLQQHARNPVDWFPWGTEAFEKARKEHKPIFLSIGYSTCHWCHVMEHESFENHEIAKILNDYFVAIKVDREERPDVDRVYMTYLQAIHGSGGGWPLSVWLTPDLRPFFAGTYFPPNSEHRSGQPGFKELLAKLNEAWLTKSKEIIDGSQDAIDDLVTSMNRQMTGYEQDTVSLSNTSVQTCYTYFVNDFDDENGGFGTKPKFPQPVNFQFLLNHAALMHQRQAKNEISRSALNMVLTTLKKMALGGINDHLGKGFHRYSTDERWHVPHFEKMLYDQGQIASALADAYAITKDPFISQTLIDLISYVERDLRHPQCGGFYCAEDADSLPSKTDTKKREGAFYAWTDDELNQLLSKKIGSITYAQIFSYFYQCKNKGNVNPAMDPHDELKNQNVLITDGNLQSVVEHFRLENVEQVQNILNECHEILLGYRNENRPRPHRDEKILVSWNSLMISGLARTASVLQKSHYIRLAEQSLNFIREYLIEKSNGQLLRVAYIDSQTNQIEQNRTNVYGFLDDYSYLIQACLDLYEANFDQDLLVLGRQLQKTQDDLFWDSKKNRYLSTDGKDSSIILQLSEDHDGAEPSPNGISALNLLRLGHYFNDQSFLDRLRLLFKSYGRQLTRLPMTMPTMIRCFDLYQQGINEIIIHSSNENEIQRFTQYIQTSYVPNTVVILLNSVANHKLLELNQRLHSLIQEKTNEETRIFLCRNFQCERPCRSFEEFKEKFDTLLLK